MKSELNGGPYIVLDEFDGKPLRRFYAKDKAVTFAKGRQVTKDPTWQKPSKSVLINRLQADLGEPLF